MLKYYNYDIQGKHAVVVGRSRIVDCPGQFAFASQCNHQYVIPEQMTWLVLHVLPIYFLEVDRQHIKKDMVKKDAIVVDIGINSVDDATKLGYRLVGDVDYDDVVDNVQAINSLFRGVGPMTIAMLLNHTVCAAQRSAL